jgi:hypothetical protein
MNVIFFPIFIILPLAMRNFGIKSTFQSRPRPVSLGGGGKLNFE